MAIQDAMQHKNTQAQVLWAYVYVVRSGDYRKVGYTLDLKSRLAQLQTGSPVELVLEQRFIVDRRYVAFAEFVLHERLKQHHAHGEWFTAELPEIESAYRLAVIPQLRLKNARLWEETPRERPVVRRKRKTAPSRSSPTPWQLEMIKATSEAVNWLDLRLAEHKAKKLLSSPPTHQD